MSNLSVLHLIGAIIYLSFGVFVLMRNRHARHYQLFSLIMLLFFWESISFLITDTVEARSNISRLFYTQSLVVELFIPPFFTWFVLVLSQKYRIIHNGFFFGILFAVPVLLLLYHFLADNATSLLYKPSLGGYLFWNNLLVRLGLFLYVFLNALLSLVVILRFGLNSIDYRIRVLAKTVTVAVIVVFGYSLLDQFQYILYEEKIAPDIYDLVSLVGFAFVFVSLIKQKQIIFSSSVLSENILEHLTAPVFLMDDNGRISYYNKYLQEITAYRPSELNGMYIRKLMPGLRMSLNELLRFGRYGMHHIKTNVKDAFDNYTKVILSLRTIYGHAGDFVGIVCIIEGVNKPMQGQYDSRNQDERLINAFAASDKGFWDWDIKRGELFFSETACHILGYDPAELANLSFTKWREMLHHEFRDDYFDTLNKHLKQESDSFYMEYKVRRKDGDWVWILDKGRITAFDSENNPERMSGVFSDITRVKKVEDQLRKYKQKLEDTLKFKNKLLDFLSTDIREPFNTIIGVSNVLSVSSEIDEAEQKQLVDGIAKQAYNAYELIDEILHLAKIDEGRVKKQPQSFNLQELIEAVLEENRDYSVSKKITFNINAQKLSIKTDKAILQRILSVFVDNAIKFSYENQTVDILWGQENGDVWISVRDYGLGMTLNEQKKLFKIDETFARKGTKEEQGHGIGLLIAERLALILDARITFRSSKNEGSEFVITLPVG